MKHGGLIGLIIAVLGFTTVIILGVNIITGLQPQTRAAPAAAATSAPVATTQDGTAGAGPSRPAPPPVAGQPLTLSVPSVGLTTRLGSMRRPSSGTVDPPTSSIAYWISSYGTAGPDSANTVYIAGHTCRGCRAVFSPFLNIPTSSTLVDKGDKVYVGTPEATYTYTVTATALYEKATIQSDAEMWKVVPGRLVLVTCFQYLGGTSSQQNFVIYAQLDPGQGQ